MIALLYSVILIQKTKAKQKKPTQIISTSLSQTTRKLNPN